MRHRLIAAALVLLATAQAACGGAVRRESPPAAPAPAPASAPPAAAPVGDIATIRVCVVQDGDLRVVQGLYHPSTRDTTVDGRPFSAVHPDTAGYAGAADWYVRDEPIFIDRRRHVKYGLPRVIHPHELTRVGEYRGVPLFAEKGAEATSDILYVPVRPGCELQPYDGHANVGAVRG